MKVIHADHIGEAFKKGVSYLLQHGERSDSRNGTVLRSPYPVTTIYRHPRRRVLVNALRNANPFFHLMEAMWMLDGRNDVSFVAKFNKRMKTFSDDGRTFWGAYGWRWRSFFGLDQLERIEVALREDENSRRCVLTMWSPESTHADLHVAAAGGRDVPCNTHAYFIKRADGALDMTVCNRSNDAIWGCYGANAVHFSILHEYMSLRVNMRLGRYYQVSNDLHAYTDIYSVDKLQSMVEAQSTYYPDDSETIPLLSEDEAILQFRVDLREFMSGNSRDVYRTRWFNNLVVPMNAAWRAYKSGLIDAALMHIERIPSPDWRNAARFWMENKQRAAENQP